jgi:hypothetical protein
MAQNSTNTLIRFNYLYRDGANYKKWNFIDFQNPDGLKLEEIHRRLEKSFDMGCLFNAKQAGVPEVFLFNDDDYSISTDDHCFHEYDSVEVVDVSKADIDIQPRSIDRFVKDIEKCRKDGWDAFDPRDMW